MAFVASQQQHPGKAALQLPVIALPINRIAPPTAHPAALHLVFLVEMLPNLLWGGVQRTYDLELMWKRQPQLLRLQPLIPLHRSHFMLVTIKQQHIRTTHGTFIIQVEYRSLMAAHITWCIRST
jgi:hypothetical protein